MGSSIKIQPDLDTLNQLIKENNDFFQSILYPPIYTEDKMDKCKMATNILTFLN